jgi:hypothetical protein
MRARTLLVGGFAASALVAGLFTAAPSALAQAESSPPPQTTGLFFTDNGGQGLSFENEGHNNQPELVAAGVLDGNSDDPSSWNVVNEETISGVVYFQLENASGCLNEGTGNVTVESCPVDNSNELIRVTGTNGNELEFKLDSKVITTSSVAAGQKLTLTSTLTPSDENQWEWTAGAQVERVQPVDFVPPSSADWTTIADTNPPGSVENAIFEVCAADGSCGGSQDENDTAWDSTLTTLDTAGIEPLYYISSVGGTVPLTAIETSVSNAEKWYGAYGTDGIDGVGIMIDQVDGTATDNTCVASVSDDVDTYMNCETYYQDIYDYLDGSGTGELDLDAPMTLNPGTWPTADYVFGVNVIVQVFENDVASIADAADVPSWALNFPSSAFAATVEGATATGSTGWQADIATLSADNIGNVYVTSQGSATEGAPYNALPSWWAAMAAYTGTIQPGYVYGDCGNDNGVVGTGNNSS